jgi:dienelactone hydrolase
MVTQEQIENFKKEMEQANADYQFISYPGAMHSFTNPAADSLGEKHGIPIAYSEEADQKSWERMKQFFNQIFME